MDEKYKRDGEHEDLAVNAKRKKIEKDEKTPDACEKPMKTKIAFVSPALFHVNGEISHEQIHELLRYATLGKRHSAAQPSWCHLYHQRRLAGVVVLILQDTSRLHFSRFFLQLTHLRKIFRHRFGLPHPPSNFVSAVLGLQPNPTTQTGEEACAEPSHLCRQGSSVPNDLETLDSSADVKHLPDGESRSENHGLTKYLLSEEKMREGRYPVLGLPDSQSFVHTGCSGKVTDSSPLFGLDCEMCLTKHGKELVRVSLVDASGQCVMDELVKPHNPVLNYLTSFSGITKEILQPIKTRLKDVQDRLKHLLPLDAVLVGHSINNDLQALQMIHPNVIDTSLLFTGTDGRKFKLKFLAEAFLRKEIQRDDRLGHDSREDARAALELVQYLILQEPRKNNASGNSTQAHLQLSRTPCDALTQALNEPPNGTSLTHPGFLDILQSNGQRILVLGRKENYKGFLPSSMCENIMCISNEEVLQRAREKVPQSFFSIIQFSLNTEDVQAELMEEMNEKMRMKMSQMMSVYVGPLSKHVCLQSVRKIFQTCGPILSFHVVTETHQPYVCIQYEVLEAAQLAVEALNGANVEGCCIKVQRPVSEFTLEWDLMLKELEEDIVNEGVIYISGFKKTLTEKDLQLKFSHFKDIEAVFLPQDHKTGKLKKYCFLKFPSSASAMEALQEINEQENGSGKIRGRKALTPSYFHEDAEFVPQDTESSPPSEHFARHGSRLDNDLKDIVKKLDRSIYKLYKTLQSNTLCVVLLPGTKSSHRSFSGFGLIGIKEDNCSND
ncbi:RNA exonuclease 5 isoform X2 [Microcaecilia unicolor]|uniref:RNA exonuclease 5 isoform X2 n=1 Tax=Microcaecilia unicolor TaxID=1415580 RepID=A0A6P7YVK9_9AMPH|nr:RNA exonuclease 5 isoform X2 [Microcaecilia unicolor]